MDAGGAFGIDIGSKYTVIASVKGGGIEIVHNESAGRETPSVVSFGENERLVGDSAVAQMGRNHKNTLPFFQRFLGLNADCAE